MRHLLGLVALAGFSMPVLAAGEDVVIAPPEEGSVSREEGLAAWERIYEVASHPRCANCHVGEDNLPMWSGPSYGETRPHGMNIDGGESRIGAEYVPCQTCHAYNKTGGNNGAHEAPQVADSWHLAPVEMQWFGKSSVEICNQLREPERNGGQDHVELAEHLGHGPLVSWGWAPGGGREPAPYSLQAHIDDMLAWGVAGFPCEND
ncbi:hypothetical protein [Roseovarius indicus]|uniref:hypothetical protein n=1 Tax=Roseovarius indicus TaxID=540747 RepID=UPI0007D95E48|nr:hypothetical protein [Roseovarius indicus]OAO02481.1 hypothetical protein A8B76_16000 [Roseovarius indicus]